MSCCAALQDSGSGGLLIRQLLCAPSGSTVGTSRRSAAPDCGFFCADMSLQLTRLGTAEERVAAPLTHVWGLCIKKAASCVACVCAARMALRHLKRVFVQFTAGDPRAVSARDFLARLSGEGARKSNPQCKVEFSISETAPHGKAFVDLTFNDGTQVVLPVVGAADCTVSVA